MIGQDTGATGPGPFGRRFAELSGRFESHVLPTGRGPWRP